MSASNDNYTIHKVSLKRTRQACGPCRRKKARCPGEKPVCSLCHRLGQRCVYGPQAAPDRVRNTRASSNYTPEQNLGELEETSQRDDQGSERLQRIEERLERMTALLLNSLPRDNLPAGTPRENLQARRGSGQQLAGTVSAAAPCREDRIPAGITSVYQGNNFSPSVYATSSFWLLDEADRHIRPSLPRDFLKSEVDIYLAHFHDQPYCVFSKDWLLSRASSLPPEIVFPLVALTSGLSHRSHEPLGSNIPTIRYCAETAWGILSSQYRDRKVGLSFLQGTCLMAQVDFASGRAHRAHASVALGLRTLQSAGLNKDPYPPSFSSTETEQRRRITWAFFMLDRSYTASRNYSLCLADKHFTLPLPLPDTPTWPKDSLRGTLHDGPGESGEKSDHGILACLLRLYSLWGKATEYVFEPFDETALPPWRTGSALAVLESEWLQFETRFADIHRYINVDFRRRAQHEPQSHAYLSTWLCVQFLFHSIQCLLHHPFVIMIKLRGMKGNLSATFLQKSFETSLLHSRWIVRFIKEMSEVEFRLHDPFMGYLAAIAATIQLEHTGSKNPQIALLVNKEFRVLMDFMTELSAHWENMAVLVNRVNELAARHQNYGSLYYNQDGYSGALSSMPTSSNIPRMSAEDEALMWDILDLSSSSCPPDTSQLGDLVPSQDGRDQDRDQDHQSDAGSSPRFPEQLPTPTTTQETGPGGDGDEYRNKASLDQDLVAQDMAFPYPRASESMGPQPISEWPFLNRHGADGLPAAIPDIPDWMMLDEYMTEHL